MVQLHADIAVTNQFWSTVATEVSLLLHIKLSFLTLVGVIVAIN
jgi:hypothetical protein